MRGSVLVSLFALVMFIICATAQVTAVASDDPVPPTDPFEALAVAASQVADMAAALKPAADNVSAKKQAVARKQSELADAQAEEDTAETSFNEALTAFIAAVEALKEAAMQIPPANGGNDPPPAASTKAANVAPVAKAAGGGLKTPVAATAG